MEASLQCLDFVRWERKEGEARGTQFQATQMHEHLTHTCMSTWMCMNCNVSYGRIQAQLTQGSLNKLPQVEYEAPTLGSPDANEILRQFSWPGQITTHHTNQAMARRVTQPEVNFLISPYFSSSVITAWDRLCSWRALSMSLRRTAASIRLLSFPM